MTASRMRKPRPRSASQACTPPPASSPKAEPPESVIASMASTVLTGSSRASSRVPGPPPRTSTEATAGLSNRMAVTPEASAASPAWPTLTPAISVRRFFNAAALRRRSVENRYPSRSGGSTGKRLPDHPPRWAIARLKSGAGTRTFDGRPVRNAALGECRLRRQRDREPAQQPLSTPVEIGAPAELGFDAGQHAARAKALRGWFAHRRATFLAPDQVQNTVLVRPGHGQPSRQRRQRAILGGVGDELMQRQGQRLRGRRPQLHLGAGEDNLVADGVGREFLIHQAADFGALPARQRQYRMHPRQRVDADRKST